MVVTARSPPLCALPSTDCAERGIGTGKYRDRDSQETARWRRTRPHVTWRRGAAWYARAHAHDQMGELAERYGPGKAQTNRTYVHRAASTEGDLDVDAVVSKPLE